MGDEIQPPLPLRIGREVDRIVVVLPVGNVRLVVLKDRHRCKPTRPLVEVRHRLKLSDLPSGERAATPGATIHVSSGCPCKMGSRRCLDYGKKARQVSPIIRGGIVLFAPPIEQSVRRRGHRSTRPPKLIWATLFIHIAARRFREMIGGKIAIKFFHTAPLPVVRRCASAGGDTCEFHPVAPQFHRQRIRRLKPARQQHAIPEILRE